MSIVGTRPPLISETNLYEPRHKARLAIKPGITGMWQVSGRSDITDLHIEFESQDIGVSGTAESVAEIQDCYNPSGTFCIDLHGTETTCS